MGLQLPLENAKVKGKRESRIITPQEKQHFQLPKKSPPISNPHSRKQGCHHPSMEENSKMMMVMMKISKSHDLQNPPNNTTHHHPNNKMNNLNNISITTTISPTWKLYENPFYTSNQKPHQNHNNQDSNKQIHHLHLPVSARKIAASFWDLTFVKPVMGSELELARAQISQLKSQLEHESKSRKKMESLNKRLARELSEERKGREALERVCQELAGEIAAGKLELSRMKREMAEERKMLRTAEVIREERVQMKLLEAKLLLEEKFSEMERERKIGTESGSSLEREEMKVCSEEKGVQDRSFSFGEKLRVVIGNVQSTAVMRRRDSPEIENPHIKRGIKGFVEFPKVVKAIGCKSSKHLGSKLECQKAQLKILLKQKGPVRFNGLIAS